MKESLLLIKKKDYIQKSVTGKDLTNVLVNFISVKIVSVKIFKITVKFGQKFWSCDFLSGITSVKYFKMPLYMYFSAYIIGEKFQHSNIKETVKINFFAGVILENSQLMKMAWGDGKSP